MRKEIKSNYTNILLILVLTPIITILLTLGWLQKTFKSDTPDVVESASSSDRTISTHSGDNSSYIVAGYFANWGIYDRKYFIKDIDASKLTHVLYAFANLQEDGTVVLGDAWADTDIRFPEENTVDGVVDGWKEDDRDLHGSFKQLAVLKQRNRHLKVSLSIGGYSWSTNFPAVAASSSARKTFVSSAIELLANLGLDGIDIDWEYPKTSDDASNYVTLLKKLRIALDEYQSENDPEGSRYLLSAAMPCGSEQYNRMNLGDMNEYLDIFYMMAYDFAGSWDSKTGHQSNLYGSPFSVDLAVKDFINAGVTPKKIVVGMPLYGRGFSNVEENAPNSDYNDIPEGTWEKGSFDYKVLPKEGATEYVDHELGASWSYDSDAKEFITYDTPEITSLKCEYIKNNGLGGAMFWELSGDFNTEDSRSLVATVYNSFDENIDRTENHIVFPLSKYENIPHSS